jgi:hypothetical protein
VPLQDIFWTMLMVGVLALGVWLLFVVLRDMFERPELSGGARVGWTLVVCLLPVVGSLAYLAVRGPSTTELRMGFTSRRADARIYE